MIDGGEVIRQGKHDLVFQGLIDGKLWVAVLRRAASALAEIYLKSFRRQGERQAEVYRRRGQVLRPTAEAGAGPKSEDGGPGAAGREKPQ